MPIFGGLDIEAINLLRPTGTRHPPGITYTLAIACKKRIITTIPHQAGSHNTFGGRARLSQKLWAGSNDNIENIDTFQPIAQRAIKVGDNSFPNVNRKSVIPLVVNGAQIIRLVIKGVETDGNRPVHEPRLGERELDVFSLRSTLQPDPELLPAAGQAWPVRDVKISL